MDGYFTYDRDVLFQQVWSEPVRKLAKRYSISDVALAKVCRKLRVPVPSRGYWAQVAAGQQPVKPELEALPEGSQTKLYVRRGRREVVEFTAEAEALASREKSPDAAIVVPETLAEPHPLVSSTAKILGRMTTSDSGVVCCVEHRCLNICVAPANLDRALRIMSALIIGLETRGLKVELADVSERERVRGQMEPRSVYATRVLVDGEWIEFSLEEERPGILLPPPEPPKELRAERLESWRYWNNRPRRAYVPNGALVLEIDNGPRGSRQSWKDGKRQRVETCLNAFVAQLYVAAKGLKQARAERERREREWEEQRRQWAEEQEREEREEAREKKLVSLMSDWRRARETREFVAELSAAVARVDRERLDASVVEFVEWAKRYANDIDPLVDVRKLRDDPLLERLD